MANIAAAFLIERKSSAHRQSSTRRKKRLTIKDSQRMKNRRNSSCTSNMDDIFEQRSVNDNNDDGFDVPYIYDQSRKIVKHR